MSLLDDVTVGGSTTTPQSSGLLSDIQVGVTTPKPTTPTSAPVSNNLVNNVAVNKPAPDVSKLAATTKPADTSSLFSKFLNFASSSIGKVSDAISKATSAPDEKSLGTNSFSNTLKFLPSELARQIPGVAELQDNPEVTNTLNMGDVGKAIPTALGQAAAGFVKMPIKAVADVYDAGRQVLGKDPNASFKIPGLGEIKSNQFSAAERIANGEDPVSVALSEGADSIFNTLFFADIVNRVAGPRIVKTGEVSGNLNDIKQTDISSSPKSFRLYEEPSITNKGGAQVIPPDALDTMKSQGVPFGPKFDPAQPTFFRVKLGEGGNYTGEIMQVKPSYLSQIFGKGSEPTALPQLLGAPETQPTAPEIAPIIEKVPDSEVNVFHSKTVNQTDLVESINDTHASTPEPTQVTKTTTPPPTSIDTVAHNTLRLIGGDVSEAPKVASMLKTEIQQAITTHGEDITHQALQEKLGVDATTASRLIADAKTPSSIEDINKILDEASVHITPPSEEHTTTMTSEIRYPNSEPEKGVKIYAHVAGDTAKIESIEISKSKQKNGLGTKYVQDIEKWAADHGAKTVQIDAYKGSTGFWEKQGYTLDKEFPVINGVKQDFKTGTKDISGSGSLGHTYDEMPPEERAYAEKEIASLKSKTPLDEAVNDLITGKLKLRAGGNDLKAEKRDILGGHQAFLFRNNPSLDTLDTVASNVGVSSDELLQHYMDRKINMQAGFINMGQAFEDVANLADKTIKDFVEKSLVPIKIADNFSESIVKLEGEAQADVETINKIIQASKITVKDDEAVYHHAEDPNVKLTANQEKLATQDKIFADLNKALFERIKGTGTPLPENDLYIPRIVKEKPSPLQRIFNPVGKGKPTAKQGGILSKSTPSLKHRTMLLATNDATGEQIVVHIPTDKTQHVTGFKGKTTIDLGPINSKKGGMRKADGTAVKQRLGDKFVDKDGNSYTIGQATTKQIEANTNLEYYHSALASRLLQYVKLRQIDRAIQFMDSWKESNDFKLIAKPSTEIAPEGWRMSNNIYFRNFNFEPRTAEIMDDMQKQIDSGQFNDAFTGINRVLVDSIFFNGLAHPINVAVTWTYNRGISGLMPNNLVRGFKAGARALEALTTKNEDYMDLLRNGAHLMSSDVNNQKVAENMVRKLNSELNANPDLHEKITNALTILGDNANPLNFKKNIIYKLSHDMAWLSNDFLTMQSIFEEMDRSGKSMPDAIKETARFIPDYRKQSRLLDKSLSAIGQQGTARGLSKIVYNRNISMFGAYHVGLFQSFNNAVKDTITGDTLKDKARGADRLAMLALLMLVVYPWLDKVFQKVTGSPNTYVTRSGITKYPYLAYKAATGQTNIQAVTTAVLPPAVGLQAGAELFFNRDFFTGNTINGIGGEGFGKYITGKVAPAAEANKVASGKTTGEEFALTLIGVHTPANQQAALDLNSLIYNEKPNVLKEAKAYIAAGDEAAGLKLVQEFNQKLLDQIKKTDNRGNTTPARVQYFFNQYGLKMPGKTAMDNYVAKQGKNIVQKVLPDGKPVINKGTALPATGVIGTITTYAKAIGVDPITAFRDIFSGQSIKQVTNGTIIVNRMSVSQSQADKKTLGGGTIPKGMTLDHRLSLELGGTNDESNLQLVPAAQAKIDDQVENYLGDALKNGGDKKALQQAELDYKDGKITFDEIKAKF